ncbi:hypothetical protein CHLNCDRAFT_32263 [Chlorella variabilis]|uniref:RRM domain-containing protein n=1 Tax=Chlorella variabilis TaxID=554065 RepID=E1ZLB3_CHLVA|nr:hypothetical protein CHLNCDRAFT_32263 [Chlorella variabilis]EFN53373.1 hypothetical protein CHLNCDRAFT_32263 [Chlorella variabilis]|eukprot:XP_005845475.1 hypothetical protein CHLNCDRAFT_32263 [Chlorella variabilis]
MADEEVMHVGRRVYVSNLAWRTSWQDLKDKFRECGNVVYSNVIKDESGRSKGWGIVEFETPEEALTAINTLNGVELGGRTILVREDREDRDVKQENGITPPVRPPREPREPRAPAPGRGRGRGRGPPPEGAEGEEVNQSSGLQIVVNGLPWAWTWKELKDLMAGTGNIVRADVVYGRDGRSRGYGTVRYETAEEAEAAIEQFNGSDLEGRTLSVRLDKYA